MLKYLFEVKSLQWNFPRH